MAPPLSTINNFYLDGHILHGVLKSRANPRTSGRKHMFYVYVLKSQKDNQFYIGYTADLKTRVKSHNAGSVKSTSLRRPLLLLFYEAFLNKFDALRRERYFKSNPGKKTLKLMLRETLK